MKQILMTVVMAIASTTLWAQAKQEATIQIIVDNDGKKEVIERRFSDLQAADKAAKTLSDSIEVVVKASAGKKKIVTVNVMKKSADMSEKREDDPKRMKRVIIRKGNGKPADVTIMQADDDDAMDLHMDASEMPPMPPMPRMMMRRAGKMKSLEKMHENMGIDMGSKTIKGLGAKPNVPFNGKLNINFNAAEKGNVSISVMDVQGKEIASETIKDFEGQYLGQIDLKKSSPGVYFLRVSQGDDGAVRRIKID